jgi:hypothetical protein
MYTCTIVKGFGVFCMCVSLLFTEPLFPECVPGCCVRYGCSSPILIFTVEGVYPLVLSWFVLFYVTRLVASCLVFCNYEIKPYVFCHCSFSTTAYVSA